MQEDKIQKAKNKRIAEGKKVFNLSFADFTCLPSLFHKKKMQRAFVNIFAYPYYYPSAKGDELTRKSIAKYYAKKKVILDKDNIVTISTSNEALAYLFKLFALKKKNVLCPQTRSFQINEIALFSGAKLVDYSIYSQNKNGEDIIDITALKNKIDGKTGAILLQNPHSPTGKVIKDKDMKKILNLCSKHDVIPIIDESYADFVFVEGFSRVKNLLSENKNAIIIDSIVNSFAVPGVKIAWIIFNGEKKWSEKIIKETECLADTFLTLNQFTDTIIIELLKYGFRWTKKVKNLVAKNREILKRATQKSLYIPSFCSEGGIFSFFEINTDLKTEDFCSKILEKYGLYFHPAEYYNNKSNKKLLVLSLMNDSKIIKFALKKTIRHLKKLSKTQ